MNELVKEVAKQILTHLPYGKAAAWVKEQHAKRKESHRPDRYLNYSYEVARTSYAQSDTRSYIKVDDVTLPYELVHDYRVDRVPDGWGKVVFGGTFQCPGHLETHKREMVEQFMHLDRLSKKDNPAPRLSHFALQSKMPEFYLQKACYYDQVGTNLTLDYELSSPIECNGQTCHSVRQWDVVQANGRTKRLPSFRKSKLANTIGVAVGISAKNEHGQKVWLIRKRTNKVAVYAGMWHLPFSFALCMGEAALLATHIQTLIGLDVGAERADELGLEESCFNPLRPVAFCRDLARGGKPQFFLECSSKLNVASLTEALKGKGKAEYEDGAFPVHDGVPLEGGSAELQAFLALRPEP